MSNHENNKRIVKNTLALYFRQIITMIVSLFTSRIVLQTLGVTDYGINNVVGGVVAMFSFLSNSIANAMNRFFSFELGRKDYDKLHKIFCLIMLTFIIIGIIIVVLAETVGLWWVNNKLIISPERLDAARWVFHASVFGFFISLINTPYVSLIIARENMSFFAWMSIADVVGKLLAVCSLVFIPFDNLKTLAVLGCITSVILMFVYHNYCTRRFYESRFKFYWNKFMFKEIIGYASMSLFGSTAGILRDQGVNILLNMFYGPIVNTARGIANSVNAALFSFSLNAMFSVNPQIIKSYASGNNEHMWLLIMRASKIYFFLLFVLCFPIFLEARFVLQLWLGQVPQYSVDFLRLILITSLISVFVNPLGVLNGATGKIKKTTLINSCINFLVLPFSYFFCKNGFPPHIVFIVTIGTTFCVWISIIIILKFQVNFPVRRYLAQVILPVIAVSILVPAIPVTIKYLFNNSLIISIAVISISMICSISTVFFVGLTRTEKNMVANKIRFFINKFTKKDSIK